MKALSIEKFGGPDVMKVAEVPVPEPGAGQVRIRVEAAGLNYADIMICYGHYIEKVPLPYVLGREFCGTIDKFGPGTNGLRRGERVVGIVKGGAMAEYVIADLAGLIPCPKELTPEQGAAMFIQGVTAVHLIDDVGQVKPGETVLVHAGAGGVGTLAIQIARARGANVIGTASTDEKCRLITELGARAINYLDGDWVAKLRRITNDRGADVILEAVGGEVFRRSFKEALADFGRLVVYGLSGKHLEKLHNREILESNRAVIGYFLGAYFPKHMDRVVTAARKLREMLASGQIRLVIGRTFSLDEAPAAFEYMERRQSVGKVVITV
jgi:NADPH2:quinone reductase